MNGTNVNGNRIIVELAKQKEDVKELTSSRLYVGNIGSTIKKRDLIVAFGPYGELIDILMKDDYAFIEYSTIQAALRALNAMRGALVNGTKLTVEGAKPKEPKSMFIGVPEK